MGFYPYVQKCPNGHEWGAVFISVSPMSDSGRDTCPECGAPTLPPNHTRSTTKESEPQKETGAQTPPPPNVGMRVDS